MKSVLYIVSKSAQSWPDYQFMLNSGKNNGQKTVVLLENRVIEEGLDADHIYELKEGPSDTVNGLRNDAHSRSDVISYRGLLDLIFSSDHSIVV